jgi:hypothetical protein
VLRELAQSKKLGRNPNGKYWSWTEWAKNYIRRSRSHIKACIRLYEESRGDGQRLAISQDDNVVTLRSQ